MKAGRNTKYTPETVAKILQAIRLGGTYRIACSYAGINEDTLLRWRNIKPEFAEAMREAEGSGAVGWLAKIEKAASDGDWRAASWKLERRFPQEYGRTVSEISGPEGGPIQTEDVSFSDDDRATRILAVLERARIRAGGPVDSAEPDMAAAAGSTD